MERHELLTRLTAWKTLYLHPLRSLGWSLRRRLLSCWRSWPQSILSWPWSRGQCLNWMHPVAGLRLPLRCESIYLMGTAHIGWSKKKDLHRSSLLRVSVGCERISAMEFESALCLLYAKETILLLFRCGGQCYFLNPNVSIHVSWPPLWRNLTRFHSCLALDNSSWSCVIFWSILDNILCQNQLWVGVYIRASSLLFLGILALARPNWRLWFR